MIKTVANLPTSSTFPKGSKLIANDSREPTQDCIFINNCLEPNNRCHKSGALDLRSSVMLDNTTRFESSQCCYECGQDFDCSEGLEKISNRNPQDPDVCQGCKKTPNNQRNEAEFTFDSTLIDKNTVVHYSTCSGCVDFVKTKRRTLRLVTNKKAGGEYVASVDELFEFLVESGSTCGFTGMQGSWVPFPDHIIPLSGGGSSDVSNLQVTLQFLNNI
ncbi:hypothetical protein BD408DRAFT_483520 [Parasitella parasitica]|nr:hypothetical protein BD408DRAFT_483520 [Parasitella parasitica]